MLSEEGFRAMGDTHHGLRFYWNGIRKLFLIDGPSPARAWNVAIRGGYVVHLSSSPNLPYRTAFSFVSSISWLDRGSLHSRGAANGPIWP